ncbi:MAG: energy-coupling factor transporter transmembrane protein EcfT [Planctomycetes bacterium]|nr:energy-coupling factor transporter transmembrane protein EcfT [Planctomycetota bacterium]
MFAAQDFLLPLPRRGLGLDPRTKILLLAAVSLVAVALDQGRALLGLFSLAASSLLWIRPPWRRLSGLMLLLALGTFGTMVSQALFYNAYPRTAWVILADPAKSWLGRATGGIALYREGLAYGAVQSLRLSAMLAAGLAVCWTTDPRDLLSALHRLRIPEGLCFMTITAVRFLPLVLSEAASVWASQRLRGVQPFRYGPISLLFSAVRMLRPVFANCVRRATVLAASVQSRAYDPARPRTSLQELRLRRVDWAVGLSATLATLLLLVTKALYLLYLNEIFYSSRLRPLYTFVREVL